ncbi:MAG: hypothetical protein ACOX1V_02440 [Candidatus Iainarchaeum sp.]|jgi:hypothetical protein
MEKPCLEDNLEEVVSVLLNHCYDMDILKPTAENKKKEAILDSLIISMIKSKTDLKKLKECIEDVKQDTIINTKFFDKGGNLFRDCVNSKWESFAKELFRQRSVGLGTPNAASGEGELMLLFLSKKTEKPTKGDIKLDGKIIELKGDQPRVMGEISGNNFRNKTLEVCKSFNLTPNKAFRTNKDAVEVEKVTHLEHWKRELAKLDLGKQKDFINKWLKCIDNENHEESVEKIFVDETFNHPNFIKEIIKILYAVMVADSGFDLFVILGDGTNVKIVKSDVNDFNQKVESGEITPQNDYFRINQRNNIGWYIK